MDPAETRRRINAARELAEPTEDEIAERWRRAGGKRPKRDDRGYGLSVDELASRIPKSAKLGSRTLGKIMRGEREALTQELRFIAEACRLPEEFFSAEIWSLAAPSPAAGFERRLTRIEQVFSQFAALGVAEAEGEIATTPPPQEQTAPSSEERAREHRTPVAK